MERYVNVRLVRRLGRCWQRSNANEEGLTLLEVLMAIIVVGISVSAVTPAFVLALATRVQSQRAEQAMQLAQEAIDRARIVMELGAVDDPGTPAVDDGIRANLLPADAGDGDLDAVAGAPDVFLAADDANCLNDYGNQPAVTEACSVDINNDGEADFAVQTYLANAIEHPTIPDELVAFDIGVRVYASEAVENIADLSTEPASVGLSNNPRGGETSSGRSRYLFAPLAVVYSTVVRSEEQNSLCDYYNYQGTDPLGVGLTCD